MNINSNYASIYGFYNNLFQNTMSMYSNKLSKMMSPVNNALSGGTLSATSSQYASEIKSSSGKLSEALKGLTDSAAWDKKTLTSSNDEVMSVKYSGSKYAEKKEMSVKIDQVAAGQKNEGEQLKANAAYGSTGTNKFAIEIDGKKTELSINAASGDTNKDVQQKMADAINKAGIGVTASVVVDSKTNTSSLKIEAKNTGNDAKNKFTIKDVTGNAVAKTGASNVTQTAQDAVYSVNGGEKKTSKTNTVDLGSGVTATLKKASNEAVKVVEGTDKSYGKDLVRDMVKSFNELYDSAADNASGDAKASKLLEKLVNTAKTYSGSLSALGINIDKDGRMSIDSEKLNKAAENGKLEKYFTENNGKSYGFANQMQRLAGDVEKNTSNYVSKSALGDSLTQNFAYSGYGELIQYNYLSAGSIFDYSF